VKARLFFAWGYFQETRGRTAFWRAVEEHRLEFRGASIRITDGALAHDAHGDDVGLRWPPAKGRRRTYAFLPGQRSDYKPSAPSKHAWLQRYLGAELNWPSHAHYSSEARYGEPYYDIAYVKYVSDVTLTVRTDTVLSDKDTAAVVTFIERLSRHTGTQPQGLHPRWLLELLSQRHAARRLLSALTTPST